MIVKVEVNNMTKNPKRYIVARVVDGQLWYFSTWKIKEDAERTAMELDNAIVLEVEQ